MTSVRVNLDPGYDVFIGSRLLKNKIHIITERIAPVFIVIDENVAALWQEDLKKFFMDQKCPIHWRIVPGGEASKNPGQTMAIVDWMLDHGVKRSSCLLAVGGGVIGDLAGFAASIVLRGIDLVHLPTTLLAQVDSAIGGKTGVNTKNGKNLVGTFHQPRCVLCDSDFLKTLPIREMRAGYAEIVKYALINDSAFFDWLEKNGSDIVAGKAHLCRKAVMRCCHAKGTIVEADEKESGRRALLNLGHTFAHALEAAFGYNDRINHGEAVAIGLHGAFLLSEKLSHCPDGRSRRIEHHLRQSGLPTRLDDIPHDKISITAKRLISFMQADKKSRHGELSMILARDIGKSFIATDVPAAAVADTWQELTVPLKTP